MLNWLRNLISKCKQLLIDSVKVVDEAVTTKPVKFSLLLSTPVIGGLIAYAINPALVIFPVLTWSFKSVAEVMIVSFVVVQIARMTVE